MDDHVTLEAALAEMESRTSVAAVSAKKYANALARAKKCSAHGDIVGMKKALADAREALRVVQVEFTNAASCWPFSEEEEIAYFESGRFADELNAAATSIELNMANEDGQLMCYPSLIKVDAGRRAVTIDKKLHRYVRPTVLAAYLQAQQKRGAKFRPAPFVEALYAAWDYARHLNSKGDPARDVPVDKIYAVLTLAPGAGREYSRQEFGRDLFLLESSGAQHTRKGAKPHFSRGAGAKFGRGITIVREDGTPVIYSSIRFTEPQDDA